VASTLAQREHDRILGIVNSYLQTTSDPQDGAHCWLGVPNHDARVNMRSNHDPNIAELCTTAYANQFTTFYRAPTSPGGAQSGIEGVVCEGRPRGTMVDVTVLDSGARQYGSDLCRVLALPVITTPVTPPPTIVPACSTGYLSAALLSVGLSAFLPCHQQYATTARRALPRSPSP
jgi:hypothetical protein